MHLQAISQLYKSEKGSVSFFSEAPLENIDALSKNMVSVMNVSTGEIVFSVKISSLQFKNPKMQEDFNENFMESSQYPVAVYTGKINEPINWSRDGTYKIAAKGKLSIHGITKERTDSATISITGGSIVLNSLFSVRVADHGVRIPKILFEKIAEIVAVKLSISYKALSAENK
jgi:hypothetical protein